MMQLRWDLFKKLKIIIPRAPSLFKVVSLSIHGSDIFTKRMRLYLHRQKVDQMSMIIAGLTYMSYLYMWRATFKKHSSWH